MNIMGTSGMSWPATIGRLVFAACLAAVVSRAEAQTLTTWTGGGGDGDWSTGANWSTGSQPVSGSSSFLVFGGTTQTTSTNTLASGTYGRLTFTNSSASQGGFTLSGSAITISGSGAPAAGNAQILTTAISGTGSITDTLSMNISYDKNLWVNPGEQHSLHLSGVISGTGILGKAGAGTLILSGNNTFSGNVQVNGGVVSVSSIGDAGSSGNLGTAGTFQLGNANASGTLTYTGAGESTNRMLRIGSTAAGLPNTHVSSINSDGAGALVFTSSTFNVSTLTNTNTTARTLVLGGGNANDNEIQGAIIDGNPAAASGTNGAVQLRKAGTGRWLISGNNTFSGSTSITAGTLVIEHGNALGQTELGTTVSSGATLGVRGDITTAAEAISIAGTGVGSVGAINNEAGVNTLSGPLTMTANASIGAASGTLAFAGGIGGAFNLTKVGAGTVVFSGSNSYGGTTSVQAGRLVINGTNGGGGSVTIDAGAELGGSGQIGGLVTVNGSLLPGANVGVLTVAQLALNASAATLFQIDGTGRGSQYDGIDVATNSGLTYGGALSLSFGNLAAFADGDTFNLFNFTGSAGGGFAGISSTGFYAGTWTEEPAGTWKLTSGDTTLTFSESTGSLSASVIPVPEPGTLALAATALAGLAAFRRRRAS